MLRGHAQGQKPVFAEILPVGVPFHLRAGGAEKFQFHLLKLPGAEGEVAGGDLVAEGFADLGDAEGDLLAGGALHVPEVDEDALGGLRPQIDLAGGIFIDPLEGLEHHVEFADAGKVGFSALGAGDALLFNVVRHFLMAPAIGMYVQAMGFGIVLDQLVRPEAGFTAFAVHQRIVEVHHMAGGYPGFRVHQDSGIHPHVVGAFLHEFTPPGFFDVVFELHAQGTVIPGIG